MNGDGKLDIVYNGSTFVVMWDPNGTTLANTLLFKRVPPTFNFQGTGYGHGVGLSQIGARGKALAGESAKSILTYYYGGTQITSLADNQNLRVNIGHLLSQATLKSGTQGSVLNLYAGDVGEDLLAIPAASLTSKSGISYKAALSVSDRIINCLFMAFIYYFRK
jgi:hypothetical protein